MAGHAQSLHHLSIQQNKAEFQEAIDGYKMPLDPPGLLEARLDAKLQEHNHVRAQAKRVLELHAMREEQKRIEEDMELERKRLFEEQQLREQMEELNRMRSTRIEVPMLVPQQERAVTPPPPVPQPAPVQAFQAPQAPPTPQPPTPQIARQARPTSKPASAIQSPAAPVKNSVEPSAPSNTSWPTPVPFSTFSPGVQFTPSGIDLEYEAGKYHQHRHALRYLQIHGSLKQMRAGVKIMCDNNKKLKSFVGDTRRDLRKSVSQITGVRGANKIPRDRVMAALNRCLHEIPSDGVDPNFFLVKARLSPVEDAANNGPTLPILYLFFLNLFSKYILKQYVDQAGVNPEDADQIGNFCVSVFAAPANLWRGESMIDIMMAKFRVECPVLWGVRGSEGTVGGRKALGWRKHKDEGVVGDWITSQDHSTRMTGLAAGYSSIALRDFSKSSMKNPFPPPNWWHSMAAITGTEPDHVSNTQFIVLKYMIKGWEAKILNYYGDKAKLALALAVVTFPGKAKEKTPAVRAVEIIGDQLQKELGMRFFQPPRQVVTQGDPWRSDWR